MGLLTPVAIRLGALAWLPRFLPQIVWIDRFLQRLTRGRVTLVDLAGLPNLMLTVVGRKSGVRRSTPLLTVPRGGSYLVAGSNWGGAKAPVWVLNLEAAPGCEIRTKGVTRPAVARRLTGDERAAAWAHMNRTWPNYEKYQQRTDREIKVFEIVPVS